MQRSFNQGVGYLMGVNLIPRVFGQKRRDLAPLSYPRLLDLTLECHGQQSRPSGIIDRVAKVFLE